MKPGKKALLTARKNAPAALRFAAILEFGRWLAGISFSWPAFATSFIGMLLGISILDLARDRWRTRQAPRSTTDAEPVSPARTARYARDYEVTGYLFAFGLVAPMPIYLSGWVDENAAWPCAIGLLCATTAPLFYLHARNRRHGGNISEFLDYGQDLTGVPRSAQIVLFTLFAIGAAFFSVVAGYQLLV